MAYAMTGMELLQAMEQKEQEEMKARREHRDLMSRLQKLVAARYTLGATMTGRLRNKDVLFVLAHTHVCNARNGNGITVQLTGPIIKKDGKRGELFASKYEDITLAELACMEEREEKAA